MQGKDPSMREYFFICARLIQAGHRKRERERERERKREREREREREKERQTEREREEHRETNKQHLDGNVVVEGDVREGLEHARVLLHMRQNDASSHRDEALEPRYEQRRVKLKTHKVVSVRGRRKKRGGGRGRRRGRGGGRGRGKG
jgi:hypothetical protein